MGRPRLRHLLAARRADHQRARSGLRRLPAGLARVPAMDIGELLSSTDTGLLADEMYDFIGDLYPLCRSITGDGLRETLRRIGGQVPLTIHEVPTGTKVFDWVIPREWSIRDAY